MCSAVATPGRTVTGPILTRYTEFDLPLDITNTPDNLALAKAYYEARSANSGVAGWKRRHAGLMAQVIAGGSFDTVVPVPVQVWKFQGAPILRVAFTGGELVSGYGVYFRSVYGGTEGLLIGGYANENPGYLPSDELLARIGGAGSYEGGRDADYPGLAGGSQAAYGHLGHFLAGAGGVEAKLVAALKSLLD